MKNMNRRLFASTAALAAMVPSAFAGHDGKEPPPVDKAALAKPPGNGEMALGKDDAKITIMEYASMSCPHCAKFANDELPKFMKEYIDTGKARFVLREFPHNDAAVGAFMVARCAPKEKYFPLVDVMFKTQEKWVPSPLEGLKAIALQSGFTEESFMACLNNQAVAKGILDERARGTSFGVEGIPTFFINGERYKGEPTFEEMKKIIDPLLG